MRASTPTSMPWRPAYVSEMTPLLRGVFGDSTFPATLSRMAELYQAQLALPRGARAFRTADSTVARSAAGTSGGAVHRGYMGFTPGNMLVVKFSIRAAYASSVMNARQPI